MDHLENLKPRCSRQDFPDDQTYKGHYIFIITVHINKQYVAIICNFLFYLFGCFVFLIFFFKSLMFTASWSVSG